MLIKIVGNKTNFIDSNDNFVGYNDQSTSCCEYPYWEIHDESGNSFGDSQDPGIDMNFTGERVEHGDHHVSFPCTNGFSVHLFNQQNGYYWHTWESHFDSSHNSGYI